MLRVGLAVFLAGVFLVGASCGEDLSALPLGARVRIRLIQDSGQVTGTLAEIRGDEVVLSGGLAVPLAHIDQVQVSKGRKRRWSAGANAGFLLGGALGVAACTACAAYGGDDYSCSSDVGCAAGTALVTATLGSLVGLLIKSERWGDVSIEPLVEAHGGGAAVRLAWR